MDTYRITEIRGNRDVAIYVGDLEGALKFIKENKGTKTGIWRKQVKLTNAKTFQPPWKSEAHSEALNPLKI